MTSITSTLGDSATMLNRNLLHAVRYPALTGFVIGIPVILLLLFVYVLGGTLGAGLPESSGRGAIQDYLAYVLPGILVIAIVGIANGAAIGIAMDMTEGIVARFRTMAISRSAVLNGHVLGNAIQGVLVSVVLLGVAWLMGFRPTAGPLEWLALLGLVALVSLAVAWIGVALGVAADSVETASNTPMILTLLVFFGSGFVPTQSMPEWLQGFAQYQPFTTFIESIRALLFSEDPGMNLWLALGWSLVLIIAGAVGAQITYERKSVR